MAEKRVKAQSMGTVEVKGFHEPVEVFEVVAEQGIRHGPTGAA